MNLTLGLKLGGGGVSKWTPLKLPNLNTWFDAQDESTLTKDESNRVREWRDKIEGSTKKYTAAEASAPTFSANTVAFNGTSQFMQRGHGFGASQNVTFFYAFKCAGDTGTNQTFFGHSGSGIITSRLGGARTTILLTGGTSLTLSSGVSAEVIDNNFLLFEIRYNPSAATSRIAIYGCDNGAPIEIDGDAGNRTWSSASPLYLGVATNMSAFLFGNLTAVFSVLGSVSAENAAKLRAFCSDAYGVAK